MPVTGNSPRDWVPRPPPRLGGTAVKQGPFVAREDNRLARRCLPSPFMAGTALDSLAEAIRSSGLIAEASSGVALCSGGADSAALVAGLVEVRGPAAVLVLHLNYGLRPDSDRDETACRELCERFGLELVVERPRLGEGNVQAEAREARYAAAEALRRRAGARLGRDGPHPDRPRRDRHLPPRDLAGTPGAARPAPPPRRHRPPAAGSGPRPGASAGRRGGASLPRRSDERRSRSTPATGSATRSCRCSGS